VTFTIGSAMSDRQAAVSPRVAAALAKIDGAPRFAVRGRVTRIVGPVVEASALDVVMGELCRITGGDGGEVIAEVVGFHERGIILLPLGEVTGIPSDALVQGLGKSPDVAVGQGLLGRVLDGLGRPMDGRGPVAVDARYPLSADPPNPLERERITKALGTGIRAIDGLLTLGRGQRIGVFAGSGVGKSVLMGMIAKKTTADVNVIALLGERGREVREFLERDLGEEGLRRSVVIVSTSDQPPLIRARGGLVATAIAEYFRDQGKHVLLMVDSITRVAMALREVGLSIGEPPTTKGYPPSVFAALSKLLERAGTGKRGSISGLYTVLVEGDDFNEPISDAARSVLDGHIVLSRRLAARKHFPAIDVLESVSRVRDAVITEPHLDAATAFLRLEAAYRDAEDLLAVGAYKAGSDRDVDLAVQHRDSVLSYLRQAPDQFSAFDETMRRLLEFNKRIGKGAPATV
jgi:flagellum-specific ATP synthase